MHSNGMVTTTLGNVRKLCLAPPRESSANILSGLYDHERAEQLVRRLPELCADSPSAAAAAAAQVCGNIAGLEVVASPKMLDAWPWSCSSILFPLTSLLLLLCPEPDPPHRDGSWSGSAAAAAAVAPGMGRDGVTRPLAAGLD
mmetsp:Transcript_49717/g.118504  ORF Transcript_49717/g.118504 Transcript_49717/m.118504 type:complete len:143 (+) Transcript_49717:2-430(+)